MNLLELGITTTAMQYILGASRIFAPLRSRLPAGIRRFLSCPPCCGWWLGCLYGFVDSRGVEITEAILRGGGAGLVLTAIGRSLMEIGVVEEPK